MSRRGAAEQGSLLARRLEALAEARELGEGRLPEGCGDRIQRLLERASRRRALSAEHTVVGLFGATGSGKSTLFNALAGQELARVAATRPTTHAPLAGVWGLEGSGGLLDWLEVADRRELERPPVPGAAGLLRRESAPGGLILLDLPDLDSVAAAHRAISERLAGQVDVLVWVLDPQKYADSVVHRGFLRPLAAHAAVTLVVLNQVDLLRPGQVEPVLGSLRGILEQDGLAEAQVLAVSARTGQGLAELREAIARVVSRHSAATERLLADVGQAAAELGAALGGSAKAPTAPGAAEERRLAEHLAQAAGVDTVVRATEKSYRLQASARTGWPLTRWLGRLRPDPLRRLNLRRSEVLPALNRTSLPPMGAAQQAQADSALRAFADAASRNLPDAWGEAVRRAARSGEAALPDALDQAIAGTDLGAGRGSWWWPAVGVVQWLAIASAAVGFGWLGVLFALGYLQLPVPRAPSVEGFPLPTLMVGGGLLLGIVLAALAGLAARLAARLRGRTAGRRLRTAVAGVARERIAAPVAAELERYRRFREAVEAARG